MDLKNIEQRWEEHEAKPFPVGHRTKVVAGQNLTLLHSETAGYILSYLQTNGSLGSRQRIALEGCLSTLKTVEEELEGEGKQYFQELSSLAQEVFDSAHDQPTF